jgi:RNA polymerase sigma factor (sigma-70 family)
MARLAAGDREALEPLMARHYKRVYRIGLGYLRNPEDALDVVQETFVRAFEHAGRWDATSEVAPWIARIAVNQSIDRYRRNKRRRETYSPLEEGDHQESLATTDVSPERRALSGQIGDRIARARPAFVFSLPLSRNERRSSIATRGHSDKAWAANCAANLPGGLVTIISTPSGALRSSRKSQPAWS